MDQRLDLFAATPPLEAKKFLFSLAVSLRAKTGKPYKVLFIDIKINVVFSLILNG